MLLEVLRHISKYRSCYNASQRPWPLRRSVWLENNKVIVKHQANADANNQSQQDFLWFIDT
jgi:hypothetical protein|tara:strand:+ start:445 stop:627 length:183 start_codon:yes stop_codon:yes gene_type:complete